jgi:hypothetical protein
LLKGFTFLRGTDKLKEKTQRKIEVLTGKERAMAICEYVNCKGTYEPVKSWQRFCSTKCHDEWHYHQKKLAQVAEAERLRELRLANRANGNGAAPADPEPLSEMMNALKPKLEPEPSFKRAW